MISRRSADFTLPSRVAAAFFKVRRKLVLQRWAGQLTQCEGEAKVEIRPRDVITCLPGKKHWHGVTDRTALSHIAIQEADAGGNVVGWLEQVSDAQYTARLARANRSR